MLPPFVLTVLKILLLVILYFFIYRAVRSLAADLYARREPKPKKQRRPPRKAARGGAPARLVMLDSSGKKVGTYRLDGTMEIGRSSSCAIRPDDTYISQVHARVAPRGEGWVVEDMGSTNGTYLNQRRVQVPTGIEPGDRIRVGKTVLEVRR